MQLELDRLATKKLVEPSSEGYRITDLGVSQLRASESFGDAVLEEGKRVIADAIGAKRFVEGWDCWRATSSMRPPLPGIARTVLIVACGSGNSIKSPKSVAANLSPEYLQR